MDESRRKFILGMSSGYLALNIALTTGTGLNVKPTKGNIITKDNYSNGNLALLDNSSYDIFSSASVAAMLSSMMLNNLEYLYAMLIVFVTVFLLLTIGIPGYEMLLPYSEQYFIAS